MNDIKAAAACASGSHWTQSDPGDTAVVMPSPSPAAAIPRLRLRVWAWVRISVCCALLLAQPARADEEAVKQLFKSRYPEATVTSVTAAPYPGMYEVFADGELLYTDAEVQYIFRGALIDTAARRNVTEERLGRLKGIPWNQLPLGMAIKIVKGDGKRKLAIFEDPDCPYCRRLENQELSRLDNLTMYILLYPLERLHPGATEKSIRIWCSADRGKAWAAAVLGNPVPAASAQCKHPIETLRKYAEARGIFATPTLIFEDGTRISGAIPAAEIEKRLVEAQR